MNYHCKCNIKQFAKATCQHLIDVPTFRTYASGYKDQFESKTTDSIMRFCADGLTWCPHQENAPQNAIEQNGHIAQQAK
jgi:hypothetical protein